MSQEKSKQYTSLSKKSNLDQILWFVENYLPQKKDRATRKELNINILNTEIIKQIQNVISFSDRLVTSNSRDTKITFTFGKWALPYLKMLKKIGIAK